MVDEKQKLAKIAKLFPVYLKSETHPSCKGSDSEIAKNLMLISRSDGCGTEINTKALQQNLYCRGNLTIGSK